MKRWHLWGVALAALALAMLMAGCGGGAGGSSNGLGMISGTVTDTGVQLFTASRATDTATITLDGTNISTEALPGERFTLRNVPSGLHTLVVRHGNRANAVVVGVKDGEQTEVGDVTLRDAGSIAGTVTAKDTGSLLAGAKVVVTETVLTDTAAAMPHPVRAARTDANGFYSLSGIPVGNYLVTIAKPGYAPATLTLTVAVGATVTGDAALEVLPAAATGAMKGVVSLKMDDGSLKPIGGVLVRLAHPEDANPERPAPAEATDANHNTVPLYPAKDVPANPASREFYTFSADDGTYMLDGIPAGNYVAVAVRPGLEPQKQQVTIAANSTLAVDFTLVLHVPQVGIITGTVTNAAAVGPTPTPIAGAWVRAVVGPQPMPPVPAPAQGMTRADAGNGIASGADGVMIGPDQFVMYTRTDDKGQYKLLVPPAVSAIAVDADGFAPQTVAVTVTPGATATADVALQPQAAQDVTLSGIVYTASADAAHALVKTPAADATVYAQPITLNNGVVTLDNAAAVVYSAKTDAQGQYSLPLKAGPYLLYAEKNGVRSERILRKVAESGTQDFLLPPAPAPQPPAPPAGI